MVQQTWMRDFRWIGGSRYKIIHPKEITGPWSHTHKQGYGRFIDFQIVLKHNTQVSHDEDTYN